MRTARLGTLGEVSRLTLGGGGIGGAWGTTSHDESIATLKAAIDGGITVLDAAPMYLDCQAIIGQTFGGKLPDGVKITTKCALGSPPPPSVGWALAESLEASLEALRLDRVDLFFLHSSLHVTNYDYAHGNARRNQMSTDLALYRDYVVPAMEGLKAQGRIGGWGITGIGVPTAVLEALGQTPAPDAVQVIANLMDSAGAIRRFAEPAQPRAIAAAAKSHGVGVMGIRAVQAGALTAGIDREVSPNNPDGGDFVRAAGFRTLCGQWREDPAYVAHRYALSMPNIDTLVLGVKNRTELAQCLTAEAAGPLNAGQIGAIDALGLAA